MKKLFALIALSCLCITANAQSLGDAIWGVPFSSNKKDAKAIIQSKKGYTPNRETKDALGYQYKNILGVVAENLDIEFRNNEISSCIVTYKAGNKERAFAIIDSLYLQLTKQYGYPMLAEQSDIPLSIQKKNDKDYPHISAGWFLDGGMLSISITDSLNVLMGKVKLGESDNSLTEPMADSLHLGPASFWCINPAMTKTDVKAQIAEDKKMEPAKEEKDMLQYVVDEFEDIPAEAVSLFFHKGTFSSATIEFPADDKSYREIYNTLSAKLEEKYGQPEYITDSYEIQPANDSEEEHLRLLKEGNVRINTDWNFEDDKRISLQVDKDLTITVSYDLVDTFADYKPEF